MKDQTDFGRLESAVKKISLGQQSKASSILRSFTSNGLGHGNNSEDLKTYVFASALLQQVDGKKSEEANLYLKRFEIPQIQLFNVLAEKFPLVRDAGRLANNTLIRHAHNGMKAVLLDVGIGSGRQIVLLIEELTKKQIRPEYLTVIGVEPSNDTLDFAKKSILEASHQAKIPCEFVGIAKKAEELHDEDWHRISSFEGELLVNEAFAIHHVQGSKDVVLAKIHNLHPEVFVLSEPHSDHETGNLLSRFRNAWKHFGLAFDVIDRLEIAPQEKRGLKLQFFAREIQDILGNPDDRSRSERHETGSMWASRLRKSGFELHPEEIDTAEWQNSSLLCVSPKGDYIGLDFENQTVVAVLCAT